VLVVIIMSQIIIA